MTPLSPSEMLTLRAAVGWSELGLHQEAQAELANLPPEHQQHPETLEVRWLLHAEAKAWPDALTVASQLVEVAPRRASGWLHRAYALRRVPEGGLEAAWNALQPAAEKFPKEPIIAYNLACYACQMRRYEEARRCLRRALKLAEPAEIRRMALADQDLQPLWDEIPTL